MSRIRNFIKNTTITALVLSMIITSFTGMVLATESTEANQSATAETAEGTAAGATDGTGAANEADAATADGEASGATDATSLAELPAPEDFASSITINRIIRPIVIDSMTDTTKDTAAETEDEAANEDGEAQTDAQSSEATEVNGSAQADGESTGAADANGSAQADAQSATEANAASSDAAQADSQAAAETVEPETSQTVYYLSKSGELKLLDGTNMSIHLNADGYLTDAEGNIIPEIKALDGTVIKAQIDAEGNVSTPFINQEGTITDDAGQDLPYTLAYLTDESGNPLTTTIESTTDEESGEQAKSVARIFIVSDSDQLLGEVEGLTLSEDLLTLNPTTAKESFYHPVVSGYSNYVVPDAMVNESANLVEEPPITFSLKAAAAVLGWQDVNGKTYYYYADGKYYTNTIKEIDGKEYAFGSDGSLVKSQFVTFGGKKYATDANGVVLAGVYHYGNDYYLSDAETKVVITKKGFYTYKGVRYYVKSNGKLARNESFKVGSKKYIAGSGANVRKGVFSFNGKYYYADDKNVVKTTKGWVKYNSYKYYAEKDGTLYKNCFKKIGNYTYYFQANAAAAKSKVFKATNGSYYYAYSNSHVKKSKGFITVAGKKRYVRSGGKLYNNKQFKISGKRYTALSGGGAIATGIYKWKDNYYYSNSKGQVRTTKGLMTSGGKTYYVYTSTGKMYRNKEVTTGGKKYYFGDNAAAMTGTFMVGTAKYTANANGVVTYIDYKYLKGVDVSYWNGTKIDWKKVKKAGYDFAICRIGYTGSDTGKCELDSTFQANVKNAKAAGLKVTGYYFTVATSESMARKEAQFAVQQFKKIGIAPDMPIAVDVETAVSGTYGNKWNKLSNANRTKIVKAFCEEIIKQGYTPMIYASTSWLNGKLIMSQLSEYRVWVAQYYDKVTYSGSYVCWQHSSTTKVPGIPAPSSGCDVNIWYGDK